MTPRTRELRRLMRRHALTAATFAPKVGRAQSTVLQWMCGSRDVPEYALIIARGLDGRVHR